MFWFAEEENIWYELPGTIKCKYVLHNQEVDVFLTSYPQSSSGVLEAER